MKLHTPAWGMKLKADERILQFRNSARNAGRREGEKRGEPGALGLPLWVLCTPLAANGYRDWNGKGGLSPSHLLQLLCTNQRTEQNTLLEFVLNDYHKLWVMTNSWHWGVPVRIQIPRYGHSSFCFSVIWLFLKSSWEKVTFWVAWWTVKPVKFVNMPSLLGMFTVVRSWTNLIWNWGLEVSNSPM